MLNSFLMMRLGVAVAMACPNYFMRITLTLKENPLRYVEFRGNPINGKLQSDLATWLNVKLAENEVNQPKVVKT